jgi:hypothetical protein
MTTKLDFQVGGKRQNTKKDLKFVKKKTKSKKKTKLKKKTKSKKKTFRKTRKSMKRGGKGSLMRTAAELFNKAGQAAYRSLPSPISRMRNYIRTPSIMEYKYDHTEPNTDAQREAAAREQAKAVADFWREEENVGVTRQPTPRPPRGRTQLEENDGEKNWI